MRNKEVMIGYQIKIAQAVSNNNRSKARLLIAELHGYNLAMVVNNAPLQDISDWSDFVDQSMEMLRDLDNAGRMY